MGATVSRTDFTYSYSDEPHATRRKLILEKYPTVKRLMGVDPAFKWQVLALVLAQFISFYLLRDTRDLWVLLPTAYCVGGVANHAIMLAIHELSHNQGFGPGQPLANKMLAIFANLPIGVPMSISFKKYHIEHHRYQGDELLDTDIPTFMEASFFTSPAKKLLWCLLQPFFYTLRPLFVHPKPISQAELANVIIQLAFDALVVRTLGWHILAYMIGGSILAMGLHPVAGHFISEHTLLFESVLGAAEDEADGRRISAGRTGAEASESISSKEGEKCSPPDSNNNNHHRYSPVHASDESNLDGRLNGSSSGARAASSATQPKGSTVDARGQFLVPETCSYYGPLNWVTFNVGYHVEHHDFPSIPGSRLHLLSKIAPEFYANLNHHTSWTYVLWQYITDPKVSPASRVRRPHTNLNPSSPTQ